MAARQKPLIYRFSEGSGEDFSTAHDVNGLGKALIRLGIGLDENSAHEVLQPSKRTSRSKSAGLIRNLIDVAMSVIMPVDLSSVVRLSSVLIKSSEDFPKKHHIEKTDAAKHGEKPLDQALKRQRELEEQVARIVLVDDFRKESELDVGRAQCFALRVAVEAQLDRLSTFSRFQAANIHEIGASVAEAQNDCQMFREVVERVLEIDRRWMCPREEADWRERISECVAAEEGVHKFSSDLLSIVTSKEQVSDLYRSITNHRLELSPVLVESLSELSAANALLESIN
uniref:Uncharacterized protein n=1 Tax=Rhodosorus marinus TaxID=101924 RepID=A0A7S2ZMU5_9RHOD|mmetsp:Transcript_25307/g.99955  ORF Transcript_25307/g.99955 Transcript_25307/m.99955 type:complete len:285 (+) Transcript_25307:224-1078(+)